MGVKQGVSPPVLVYFHGEGFVMGTLETHDWLCRTLAGAACGVSIIAIHYRQPPEHRFPAAFEDAYGALRWVAEGNMAKGKPPMRVAVAGDSAGGGIAAACCLRARSDPEGPKIELQVLLYPWLDLRPDSAAVKVGGACDWVTRIELEWLRNAYAPRTAKEAEVKKGS